MPRLALTDAWQEVVLDKTYIIMSAPGTASIYFGTSTPASSESGITISDNDFVEIDSLEEAGGSVWARGSGYLTWFAA